MRQKTVLGLAVFGTCYSLLLVCFFLFWKLFAPFLVSYVLFFAFKPFLQFLENRGVSHLTAVLLIFISVFGGLGVFLLFFIPAVYNEFLHINSNLETYTVSFSSFLLSIRDTVTSSTSGSFLLRHGSNLITPTPENVGGIVHAVAQKIPSLVSSFLLFISVVPFATFFFLLDARRIERGLIRLVPNRYFEVVLDLLYNLELQFGYILRGMLFSVTIVSLLSSLGLWMIGLDYPLIIGVFAGISNLIPYAGPVVGVLGAFAVAVMTGDPGSMYVSILVVFFLVQILDNTVIQPLVMSKSTNLHPMAVLLLVLIGSAMGGVTGMFLAVPVVSLSSIIFRIVYSEISRPPRPDFFQLKEVQAVRHS